MSFFGPSIIGFNSVLAEEAPFLITQGFLKVYGANQGDKAVILNNAGDVIFNVDTATPQLDVGASIVPTLNNTFDLGSPSFRFRNAYLNLIFGAITIQDSVPGGTFNAVTMSNTSTTPSSNVSMTFKGTSFQGNASTNVISYLPDDFFPFLSLDDMGLFVEGSLSNTGLYFSTPTGLNSIAYGSGSSTGYFASPTTVGGFYYTYDGTYGYLYLGSDVTAITLVDNVVSFSYGGATYNGSIISASYSGVTNATTLQLQGFVLTDPTRADAPSWIIMGSFNIAIGASSSSVGQCAVAMGSNASNRGFASVAIGNTVQANNSNAWAIGNNVTASHVGSYVWGDGSTFQASPADNTYTIRANGGAYIRGDGGLTIASAGGGIVFSVDANPLAKVVLTSNTTLDDGAGGSQFTSIAIANNLVINPTSYASAIGAYTFNNTDTDLTGSLNIIPNYYVVLDMYTSGIASLDIPDTGLLCVGDDMEVSGQLFIDGNTTCRSDLILSTGTAFIPLINFTHGATMADDAGSTGMLAITSNNSLVTTDLGNVTYPWNTIYLTLAPVIVSDRKAKDDITPVTLGLDFIRGLNPISYKLKNDTKKKAHQGFVAQEVEQLLSSLGHNTDMVCKDKDNYGLIYDHMLAPLVKAVQQLATKVDQLQAKLGLTD